MTILKSKCHTNHANWPHASPQVPDHKEEIMPMIPRAYFFYFIFFYSSNTYHMKQAIFFIENTYIIRADSFSYPAGLTFQTTKKIITSLTISFTILLKKCGTDC